MKFERPQMTQQKTEGNALLNEMYKLNASKEVEHSVEIVDRLSEDDEKIAQEADERIQAYLDRWEQFVYASDEVQRERYLSLLKHTFHRKYLIKEDEIPESYFELQRQIARERGQSFPAVISPEMRKEAYEVLYADQRESLDYWLDYLSSNDAKDAYPMWAKYWALRSVLGLAEYDKKEHKFRNRSKRTTAPFPDLNQEALSVVVDFIKATQHGTTLTNPIPEPTNPFAKEEKAVSDEDFQKLLTTKNFAKYYAFAIEHVAASTEALWKETSGEWRIFPRHSNPTELTSTLQGKGTGWCTAGSHTAYKQLELGDFHVYYSRNELGEPSIPRLAIRMEDDHIAEIRGVAHKQDIDPYIADVLETKMDEFGLQGEVYKERVADMKRLTDIDNRRDAQETLSRDDLRFLYEVDGPIKNFGYGTDPRIAQIKQGRNPHEDLAAVFDCRPDQISLTEEEALKGDIVFHYGDLYLNRFTTAKGLTLPKRIVRKIASNRLTTVKGLTLPKRVGGSIYLNQFITAEGLTLPEHVGGFLSLSRLTTAEGLTLPEHVGGNINLSSLITAEGLTLPEHVGGFLDLSNLTTAEKKRLEELYPHVRIY